MRKLSKRPPKNVSTDDRPPRSFVDAERAYLAALPGAADKARFARDEFNQMDKTKLRKAMYKEQGYLCAYCERTLVEKRPEPRIDHWRPLSQNHDVALHWKNLYLSCPTAETCDQAKRDRSLKWDNSDPHLPWLTEIAYEKIIGFTRQGEMYVRVDANISDSTRKALQNAIDEQPDGNSIRPAILALNHPALVAARAAALDSERSRLKKIYKKTTAPKDDREKYAKDLLKNKDKPFISIRVAWLRKTLGKGR